VGALPHGIDSGRLLSRAVDEQKVAYVPGAPFYPNGGGENTLRLNSPTPAGENPGRHPPPGRSF